MCFLRVLTGISGMSPFARATIIVEILAWEKDFPTCVCVCVLRRGGGISLRTCFRRRFGEVSLTSHGKQELEKGREGERSCVKEAKKLAN